MTKENLKTYVNKQIEEMNTSVDWARDRMNEFDYAFRLDWVCGAIENADCKAMGAINFASIWDESVDRRTADELREILHKGWSDAMDRAHEELI